MSEPKLSRRALSLTQSPIRRFAPLLRSAEAEGTKVIRLNIGEPDLAVPPEFDAAIKSRTWRSLPYAPSSGLPEHVAAWVKYYERFGVHLSPSDVVTTVGASEAILLSIMAVADPGDEIIVFEPLFCGIIPTAKMAAVKLVPIRLEQKNDFRLPADRVVAAHITPRTRAILVINPDNPTGKLWSRAELSRLLRLAKRHGLFLLMDETYREIVFHGRPSSALRMAGSKENVIVIDSASKRFSIPGARIGAIVSRSPAVSDAALKLAMARLSVASIEQIAVTPLLLDAARLTRPIAKEYRRRRDAMVKELEKISGIKWQVPQGAFYMTIKLPFSDAEAFVRFLLVEFRHRGQTLMLTPLEDFYLTPGLGRDEVRIAFTRDVATMRKAGRLLRLAIIEFGRRLTKNP